MGKGEEKNINRKIEGYYGHSMHFIYQRKGVLLNVFLDSEARSKKSCFFGESTNEVVLTGVRALSKEPKYPIRLSIQ
jgi:hypothetical protein